MKKRTLQFDLSLLIVLLIISITGCKVNKPSNVYLEKVLNNLEEIKSATYYSVSGGWSPNSFHYIQEYDNPKDTLVGVSFIKFNKDDTTQMTYCYDGQMRAISYAEDKCLVVDSFKINRFPFRFVYSPFFARAKLLIHYMLNTTDSTYIAVKDYGDSIQYSISVFNDRIEFIGNEVVHDTLYKSAQGEVSKYELWINKLTGLPYRQVREMEHDMTIETVEDYKLNNIRLQDFNASDYFPKDFSVSPYGVQRALSKNEMEGKIAPDWVLKDVFNKTQSLKDIKSKIIMIEFTSITCGPCLEAIPFLNQLNVEYNKDDFDFVSIDSWTKDIGYVKNYYDRNKIHYKFLMSTTELNETYQLKSVPTFFILDNKRLIRKIITGYGKGITDKEIRTIIDELI